MKDYSFSTDGVQRFLEDLYQLPDAKLQEDALMASKDLASWLTLNFALNEKQLNFLSSMEAATLSYMSAQVSFALFNRLPIIVNKQKGKRNADTPNCKFLGFWDDIQSTSDGRGNTLVSGSLIFELL